MPANIQVAVVNCYGRELLRPMNPTAQILCKLINKKTPTAQDLALAIDLGLPVEYVALPPTRNQQILASMRQAAAEATGTCVNTTVTVLGK